MPAPTFVAASTNPVGTFVDPMTCTAPVARSAGNLLIGVLSEEGNDAGTPTVPGWTQVRSDGGASSNGVQLRVFTRIADGTSADNLSATFGTTHKGNVAILAYSGASSTVTTSAASSAGTGATTFNTATLVTPSANDVVVSIWAESADPLVAPTITVDAATTQRVQFNDGHYGGVAVGDEVVVSSGTTTTARTGSSGTAGAWVATAVTVAPAPVVRTVARRLVVGRQALTRASVI